MIQTHHISLYNRLNVDVRVYSVLVFYFEITWIIRWFVANLVNLRVIKRSPVCELEALIPTVLFELPPFSKLRKFYQILHQTLTNQTLFAKVVDANVSIFYNGLKLNFITSKLKIFTVDRHWNRYIQSFDNMCTYLIYSKISSIKILLLVCCDNAFDEIECTICCRCDNDWIHWCSTPCNTM